MKRAYPLRTFLTLAAAMAGGAAVPASAAGVPAGSLIVNTASASYTANNTTQTVDSNTVTLKVDEVLDVAVASQDGGTVPVATTAALRFKVTNTGNGPEAFTLTADPAVAGNAFDATVTGLAIDVNNNGVFDSGVDTALANGAASPVLAAEQSLDVLVLVSVPGAAAPDATSKVQLGAAAITGTGAPGTLFAGAGVNGGDAVTGASGALASAQGTLSVTRVLVNLAKSAVVTDPFGGARPVPAAIITYTITASVTGAGTVTGLSVTDAIPAGTTYRPGTLTLEGAALTDGADADAGQAGAEGIAVQLGDVSADAVRTVTFQVRIN